MVKVSVTLNPSCTLRVYRVCRTGPFVWKPFKVKRIAELKPKTVNMQNVFCCTLPEGSQSGSLHLWPAHLRHGRLRSGRVLTAQPPSRIHAALLQLHAPFRSARPGLTHTATQSSPSNSQWTSVKRSTCSHEVPRKSLSTQICFVFLRQRI